MGAILIANANANAKAKANKRMATAARARTGGYDRHASRRRAGRVTKLVAAIQRRQLERLHTFETRTNRYFNPPEDVPKLGRRLKDGRFADLLAQLLENEALFGLYRNQAPAFMATHLHSRERMDEMERLYAPAEGYYALGLAQANERLNEGIPT